MKPRVKITGLLLVLAFTAGHADAQKCRYRYDKIDEISGKPSKGTAKLAFNLYSELKMDRADDQYTMEFLITYANLKEEPVEKGDSISFKLQNGNTVTFYAHDRYKPDFNASVGTIYRPKYDMPADRLKLMGESPSIHLQMNIGKTVYQKEISIKHGLRLQQDANCLLQ